MDDPNEVLRVNLTMLRRVRDVLDALVRRERSIDGGMPSRSGVVERLILDEMRRVDPGGKDDRGMSG